MSCRLIDQVPSCIKMQRVQAELRSGFCDSCLNFSAEFVAESKKVERVREMQYQLSRFKTGLAPFRVKGVVASLLSATHGLLEDLGLDFQQVAAEYEAQTDDAKQTLLLSMLANTLCNLTRFLADSEFSEDEYKSFIRQLAALGEYAGAVYGGDSVTFVNDRLNTILKGLR